MSTFLEGVQDLAYECDLPSAPSTVLDQTGEFADLVRWYQRAWREIQGRHSRPPWRWLRRTATLTTTANDDTYTWENFTDTTEGATIERFRRWHVEDARDPPKIYLASSGVGGERWLIYTPWEWFKSMYKIGTQNSGSPAHITVDPNNQILLGPKPNDAYVVTLDYILSAQILEDDDDIPEMPSDFHDLIVYRAMLKYGYREAGPEVLARAREEAGRLMRQLEIDQLDAMQLTGSLA